MSLDRLKEDFSDPENAAVRLLQFFATKTNDAEQVSSEKIKHALNSAYEAIRKCGDVYGRGNSSYFSIYYWSRGRGGEVASLENKIQEVLEETELDRNKVNEVLNSIFGFFSPIKDEGMRGEGAEDTSSDEEQCVENRGVDESSEKNSSNLRGELLTGGWATSSANTVFFSNLIYNLYELSEEERALPEVSEMLSVNMQAVSREVSDIFRVFRKTQDQLEQLYSIRERNKQRQENIATMRQEHEAEMMQGLYWWERVILKGAINTMVALDSLIESDDDDLSYHAFAGSKRNNIGM